MKTKIFSVILGLTLSSVSAFLSADTSITNLTVKYISYFKNQTSGAATAAIIWTTPSSGSFCGLNATILPDLSDTYQKNMYATVLALKLNGTPIQSISYDANCNLTAIYY